MADNINIKDSGGSVVPVSTVETTNLNGITTTPVEVQRLRAGYGTGPSHFDVDATHPLPVVDGQAHTDLAALLVKLADPATQTTLAAVLAKLSGDPATQTTLAAVLAKLSADPATQTTLAAVLAKLTGDPSTATNQATQSTKLDTLHTDLGHLTDGQLRLQPATATVFADTTTVSSSNYRGIAIKNTSTTATAEVAVRNQNVSGTVLDTITLAANESVREHYPSGRTVPSGTIYLQVLSGSVSGSVFSS